MCMRFQYQWRDMLTYPVLNIMPTYSVKTQSHCRHQHVISSIMCLSLQKCLPILLKEGFITGIIIILVQGSDTSHVCNCNMPTYPVITHKKLQASIHYCNLTVTPLVYAIEIVWIFNTKRESCLPILLEFRIITGISMILVQYSDSSWLCICNMF